MLENGQRGDREIKDTCEGTVVAVQEEKEGRKGGRMDGQQKDRGTHLHRQEEEENWGEKGGKRSLATVENFTADS